MILFLLVWSISTLGFLALAIGMEKHQKQLLSQPLTQKQTQLSQGLGWLILILALIVAIMHYHIANGISYWVGVMTFAACFTLLMLSYFSHLFKVVSISISIIIVICAALLMF